VASDHPSEVGRLAVTAPRTPGEGAVPAYPVPWRLVGRATWALLRGGRRSFAADAVRAVNALGDSLTVRGALYVPQAGPCIVACNHYSRPGFGAWWIALAVSSAVARERAPDANCEIAWVMTEAWTFPESAWRHRNLTPLTRRLFRRVANVYGFITMPPMPPDPAETIARAAAVLRTVRHAREGARQDGMIGLAPAGMDSEELVGSAPAGAGRFIGLLVDAGMPVLPVGIAESGGKLRLSFGPVFRPLVPKDRSRRDAGVAEQVMGAISDQVLRLQIEEGSGLAGL